MSCKRLIRRPAKILLILLAMASGPVADRAARAKDKPEAGPTVRGTVTEVAADGKAITLRVQKGDGTKATEEKTLPLGADTVVFIADVVTKVKELPKGKLSDLTPGTSVVVRLTPDSKAAIEITAHGPVVTGSVAATNAAKGTFTLRLKGKDGPEDLGLTLAKEAKILLSDGLTKEEKPKEAQLAELSEETSVHAQLSVDRKSALGVRVMGKSLQGTIKEVDVGNRTVTVTVKEDAQLVDKALTLVKDARVEGAKLTDLQPGQRVTITLSVFDKAQAAIVRVRSDE
jgi:hypothetical protein